MTLSSKHLQGQSSPHLDTRSATRCPLAGDEIWTHDHVWSRQEPPRRKSTRTNHRRSGNLPSSSLVVAGSHRHVHPINAGILVQDGTAHAPAGLCADKDCETIPLLKWRLDRYVLKTGRVSGVRATAATVAGTTRRFAGASTTRSTARVSAGSQGPAVIEETKENHESSCLPRHERCQR